MKNDPSSLQDRRRKMVNNDQQRLEISTSLHFLVQLYILQLFMQTIKMRYKLYHRAVLILCLFQGVYYIIHVCVYLIESVSMEMKWPADWTHPGEWYSCPIFIVVVFLCGCVRASFSPIYNSIPPSTSPLILLFCAPPPLIFVPTFDAM